MIDVVQGDITQLKVDGIVTSTNESLMGGGGVDEAVHRAAGPGLLQECMKIGICNPGQAVITNAHWLEVQRLIHTVPFGEVATLANQDLAHYLAALAHG